MAILAEEAQQIPSPPPPKGCLEKANSNPENLIDPKKIVGLSANLRSKGYLICKFMGL